MSGGRHSIQPSPWPPLLCGIGRVFPTARKQPLALHSRKGLVQRTISSKLAGAVALRELLGDEEPVEFLYPSRMKAKTGFQNGYFDW